MGLDGLNQAGVAPDVHVPAGGAGKHQVLRAAVARRHHRLLLPALAPQDAPAERKAPT